MIGSIDTAIVLSAAGAISGAALLGWFTLARRRRRAKPEPEFHGVVIADRVRALGRLVGLEVRAKEIATTCAGLTWLPPLIMSPARLAMIFHFERQYFVDLSLLGRDDVEVIGPGSVRIRLPLLAGDVRLTDVTPYDIQDGRVLGLLDVIPMNAARQRDLMARAQRQAGTLFESSDAKYRGEARASIERHLRALLELVGVQAEIAWAPDPVSMSEPKPAPDAGAASRLAGAA